MSSAQSTGYRVEFTARAYRDLEAIYNYIGADRSSAASKWYNDLEEILLSLDHLPNRGMQVPEDLRLLQLLYGNKPHIYRINYAIDHFEPVIRIIHIRHGARRPFRMPDLQ